MPSKVGHASAAAFRLAPRYHVLSLAGMSPTRWQKNRIATERECGQDPTI